MNTTEIGYPCRRLKVFFVCCIFIFLQTQYAMAIEPNGKDGVKSKAHTSSSSNTGRNVLIVGLLVIVIVGLSVLVFKMWQKRRREKQHARLLKLFEEDDELELELGLQD